jgi:hypothetical protein
MGYLRIKDTISIFKTTSREEFGMLINNYSQIMDTTFAR